MLFVSKFERMSHTKGLQSITGGIPVYLLNMLKKTVLVALVLAVGIAVAHNLLSHLFVTVFTCWSALICCPLVVNVMLIVVANVMSVVVGLVESHLSVRTRVEPKNFRIDRANLDTDVVVVIDC